MKKIPKKQFDELVRLSRKFWEDIDTTLLKDRIDVAMEIREATGIDWVATIDFIDCIIRSTGILPGASDEMIYNLLRVLGWEVADEDEESESL